MYSYPIDYSEFDSDEIVVIVEFFSLIEDANEKKVNKQTSLDFVAVIENCELARYAPGSSVSIKVDYEKASSVIASIDRQL